MASAATLVDKATSDMLFGPDWAMNLEICDVINGDPGQAKDVVKAVKKRLSNKNSRVQLLALTVLETLIKNCGEIVHQHVAEKDVLHEMTKIVKKKSDMQVRDKILTLLDSWQEAFGGSRGKYPQYYLAFEELRRSGVEFPDRAPEHNVPIFTPPRTPTVSHSQGQGAHAPDFSSPRGEPAIPPETGTISSADMDEARSTTEVLSEMLNAIDPKDKGAVVDEVIVDLLEKSRTYQKRVLHLVNTTSDEEMLRKGLSLNDDLQGVITKHDAIASGSPLPRDPSIPMSRFDQEEEGEEFSQLAHRPSRTRAPAQTGPQAALPPPPEQKKLTVAPSQREMTIDLLSGDSFHDSLPLPLATSSAGQPPQPSQPPQPPLSSVSTNPFDSDPAFHALPLPLPAPAAPTAPASSATPPNQAPVDPHPSYMQPTHQNQFSYPNGMISPTSPPPYGYRPYAPAQGMQGYVTPWAVPNNPQQTPMYAPHSQVPMTAQGGYPPASSPWGANSSPSFNQQQYAQQAAPPQQMSPQQRAMLYGNNGNNGNSGGGSLPPPPGQHSLRQQYFQQKQNSQTSPGSSGDLAGQTQNLSLQEQSLNSQSQAYGGQPLQQQGGAQQQRPAKEVLSSDRLFEDLVDLSNPNARFKAAGILSRGPSKNM